MTIQESKDLAKKYLDSKGLVCPFCNSNDLQAGSEIDFVADSGHQDVECLNCHHTWQDTYTLTKVGFYNEEGNLE